MTGPGYPEPSASHPFPRARTMGSFLRENWIWILAPMVLVLVAVLTLLIIGGGESDAGFIYNLW